MGSEAVAMLQEYDMEYLKNVVMQFVCTRQQEALLPVVAQVLHLTPSEAQKCRAAMIRYKEEEEGDVLHAGVSRAFALLRSPSACSALFSPPPAGSLISLPVVSFRPSLLCPLL